MMHPRRTASTVLAVSTLLVLALHVVVEGVSVKVEHDKTFDFKQVRTWAWNPQDAGDVIMARTADDDPEVMRQRVEPLILNAVSTEMTRRGLQAATAAPDVTVMYYLLLSTTASAQTVGQFLPATVDWGLPLFAPATQSLEIMNQGSLVLDLAAGGKVVWRGVAQAKIGLDATNQKRESLVRESVRDLLKKFPPKK